MVATCALLCTNRQTAIRSSAPLTARWVPGQHGPAAPHLAALAPRLRAAVLWRSRKPTVDCALASSPRRWNASSRRVPPHAKLHRGELGAVATRPVTRARSCGPVTSRRGPRRVEACVRTTPRAPTWKTRECATPTRVTAPPTARAITTASYPHGRPMGFAQRRAPAASASACARLFTQCRALVPRARRCGRRRAATRIRAPPSASSPAGASGASAHARVERAPKRAAAPSYKPLLATAQGVRCLLKTAHAALTRVPSIASLICGPLGRRAQQRAAVVCKRARVPCSRLQQLVASPAPRWRRRPAATSLRARSLASCPTGTRMALAASSATVASKCACAQCSLAPAMAVLRAQASSNRGLATRSAAPLHAS